MNIAGPATYSNRSNPEWRRRKGFDNISGTPDVGPSPLIGVIGELRSLRDGSPIRVSEVLTRDLRRSDIFDPMTDWYLQDEPKIQIMGSDGPVPFVNNKFRKSRGIE